MSKNPVGRPPNPERRLEIALAAVDALRERGFSLSMSELAAALSMKRPTLYFYFKDLDGILELYVTHILAEEAQHVAGSLADVEHPIDLLEAIMRESHAFFAARGLEDWIVVLTQWIGSSQGARDRFIAMVRAHQAPVRELMIETLQLAIADGRVAPCDPRAVWDLIHIVVDGGMIHQVLSDVDPLPVLDLVRRTVLAPLRLPQETAR